MSLWPRTLGKRLFKRPAKHFKPGPKGSIIDAKIIGPLVKCFGLTPKLNDAIISFIVLLFFLGSPNTVVWIIISVNTVPFKRVFRCRFISHICIEVFKIVPSFADSNSPSSVVFITKLLRILATLNHVCPTFV